MNKHSYLDFFQPAYEALVDLGASDEMACKLADIYATDRVANEDAALRDAPVDAAKDAEGGGETPLSRYLRLFPICD